MAAASWLRGVRRTALVWGWSCLWLLGGGCAESQPRVSRGLFEQTAGLAATLAPDGDIGLEPPLPALRQVNLPSGLRVGFEAAPTRGMVAVILVVGEGSTSDPPGKEGLAHLIEHLVYHARFEGRPLEEALSRLGATYNANTSLDRTMYYAFAPRAALPALLRISAQLLTQPLVGVDRAAVAIEREIVENELRQRNETAVEGQVSAWMQSALFPPDHPYARAVGGTVDSLRRLTFEDAHAFVGRGGYVPRNASLLVVGDFDPTAAVAGIDGALPAALLGDRQKPEAPILGPRQRPPAYLPPPPPGGHSLMKAPVAWPEIWLSYFLADMYGPYGPIMKVLTTSVVERTLRDKLLEDPDVTGVELQPLTFRQATVLVCRITLLSEKRRQEVADKARQLIGSLWRPGGGADGPGGGAGSPDSAAANLLWDARRLALADTIFDAEPFTGRAITRAEYFHMTGAVNAFDNLIHAVAGLQPQALTDHGAYLMAPDRARVLFVEPLSDDSHPPPGAVGVPGIDSRRLTDAPVEGMDYGDPPPATPAYELEAARRFMLPSGLRVALVRRPQFPTVTVALGFRGGSGASPPGVIEVLRLLERDGTFELRSNALQIQKLDGEDLTADVVLTGRRNLSNAFLILAARLRALDHIHWGPVMDNVRRNGTRADHESPARLAGRAFWHALYGDHPYARMLTTAELRGVPAQTLESWLPSVYNPRNATLVVAGDFDPAQAEDLVTRWFGGWSGLPDTGALDVPRAAAPATAAPHETVIVTHRPITSQVEVLLGCRLPSHDDLPTLAAARMLAGVVGGQLRTRLREEAGAAYAVSGSATVLRGGAAHLLIAATLDTRRLAEALRSIHGHWKHFGDGEFDRGSLSQVRWQLVRAENLSFQTSAETAVRVLDASNHDWSPAALARLPDVYRDVRAADLARLFAGCRSTTVISLLGDAPTIRAALAAAAAPATTAASAPGPAPAPARPRSPRAPARSPTKTPTANAH